MSLHTRIENIWWSKKEPPLGLRLVEPLYRFFSARQLESRATERIEPTVPLISVGNITAGGSGKTPFVIWLCHRLKEEGYKPVILCRGDGGSSRYPVKVEQTSDPNLVGDEARLLADLSGAPVIAARDRIAGCRMAEELGDIIILDDGFQYRHLGRTLDIVLVPASGVGNGHLIPAGPLRESLAALERADMVVRTGSEHELESARPMSTNREWSWQSEATGLIDMMKSGAETPVSLHAVTAIARPQRFFDSLRANGFSLTGSKAFPDHHRFSRQEIEQCLQLESVAVTAKDAVKLLPLWPKEKPLWVLSLKGTGEAGLVEKIIRKLHHAPQ